MDILLDGEDIKIKIKQKIKEKGDSMIFRVEINNSYNPNKKDWMVVELVGSSLEEAIKERFFRIEYRNPEFFNSETKRWEKYEKVG